METKRSGSAFPRGALEDRWRCSVGTEDDLTTGSGVGAIVSSPLSGVMRESGVGVWGAESGTALKSDSKEAADDKDKLPLLRRPSSGTDEGEEPVEEVSGWPISEEVVVEQENDNRLSSEIDSQSHSVTQVKLEFLDN